MAFSVMLTLISVYNKEISEVFVNSYLADEKTGFGVANLRNSLLLRAIRDLTAIFSCTINLHADDFSNVIKFTIFPHR